MSVHKATQKATHQTAKKTVVLTVTREGKHESPAQRRERWVRDGIDITPDMKVYSDEEAAQRGRALVESAIDADELAELDRLITLGRPSVGAAKPRGESPKRQVRLSEELDRALTERHEREKRSRSAIMRDALTKYLQDA